MTTNPTVWLQITSGRCPAECQWVVARLTYYIMSYCAKKKVDIEVLEALPGDEKGTYKSALLRISGDNTRGCSKQFCGTILWHGQSPFRPRHKRKNWYVGIESLSIDTDSEPGDSANESLEKQIKVQTFKASGKGGQNVNKRDTAVRITHLPTKLSFVGREERTQLMNKKLAMARLEATLANLNQNKQQTQGQERWRQHEQLERGNPVMRFKGLDFKPY